MGIKLGYRTTARGGGCLTTHLATEKSLTGPGQRIPCELQPPESWESWLRWENSSGQFGWSEVERETDDSQMLFIGMREILRPFSVCCFNIGRSLNAVKCWWERAREYKSIWQKTGPWEGRGVGKAGLGDWPWSREQALCPFPEYPGEESLKEVERGPSDAWLFPVASRQGSVCVLGSGYGRRKTGQ